MGHEHIGTSVEKGQRSRRWEERAVVYVSLGSARESKLHNVGRITPGPRRCPSS